MEAALRRMECPPIADAVNPRPPHAQGANQADYSPWRGAVACVSSDSRCSTQRQRDARASPINQDTLCMVRESTLKPDVL